MKIDLLAQIRTSGNGSKPLLGSPGKSYTLDEIDTQCRSLEKILQQANIRLLALHAENGPSWVVADIVCQRMNISLVPLPTFFSPLQLKSVIELCQVDYLLTDNPESLRALIDSKVSPEHIATGLQLCRVQHQLARSAVYPQETGKITFTSGSTGKAKGVCLSNQQLFSRAETLVDTLGLKAPRHLCLLPLSTLLENVAGVYAPLLAGGEVILPTLAEMGYRGSRLLEPAKMLGLIQQVQPDTVIVIPELLKLLVSAAKTGWQIPSSFKFIAVGGSKVGKALLKEAWSLGLPVYEGYGLSECASVVSLNSPTERLDGSCGKPLPNVSLKIVDGEISVSGNAMLGYVNQPETWYQDTIKTGDLGYVDDSGFVHLEGRNKNILISSYGRNISPEWPESELLANPMLQDVVVYGDARPYCVALISCRNPALNNLLIQQWIDEVNSSLPDYAQIRAWHRLSQNLGGIPGLLTANGRPCREVIAEQFDNEISALYADQSKGAVSYADKSAEKEIML